MSFLYKLGLANLWMLGDLVSGILGKDENTDAIQRTTTAITIVQAGFKARREIQVGKFNVETRLRIMWSLERRGRWSTTEFIQLRTWRTFSNTTRR